MSIKGKHIVLGISGGIAAYKSVTLLRLLIKEGAEVQVVITPHGKEFITPVTLAALSGKPVVCDFFTANSGEWHSHVDLGLWADLMVVAPATASTIAKMAAGVADNMLITTYLSAKEPVMVAPAMDLDMFAHPSTRRNLDTLRGDGVLVLDSPSGELASGLSGKGRMLEPEDILKEIKNFFSSIKPVNDYEGKNVLLTVGPTYELLDPVRFIGNFSSGKMGFELAGEFFRRGANVTVVCGPVASMPEWAVEANADPCKNFNIHRVVSALDMRDCVDAHYDGCDVAVFAAAVADYRPEVVESRKIKRENEEKLSLSLVRNPDIAAEMGARKRHGQLNVGFALESHNGLENAIGKLAKKNLDLVVLNPCGQADAGFNASTNRITIVSRDEKARELPLLSKRECARVIADSLLTRF